MSATDIELDAGVSARPFRRRLLTVACVVVVLGGCAGPDLGEGLADPRPLEADPCWPDGGRAFVGGTEQTPVDVVMLGEGTDGLLLLPGSGGNYCQWAEQAPRLVEQGYLVASVSWQWADTLMSVRAGAAALQDAGVQRYVIIGSSLGGAQGVIAAREFAVEPVGVIGLSPSFVPEVEPADDYDGPLLVIACTDDPTFSVETSRAVARAEDPDTFVELSGTAHGLQLLRGEHRADVEDMVDEFLADAFAD